MFNTDNVTASKDDGNNEFDDNGSESNVTVTNGNDKSTETATGKYMYRN